MILPNKSVPHIVRSSSALTGAYVAGNVLSSDEHNVLGLMVEYTKGDETSCEVKIEASIDGGVTYGQQTIESAAGGTITPNLAVRTFTATGNYWVVINPMKAGHIKVSAKATGGTPTGTLALTAQTSWV